MKRTLTAATLLSTTNPTTLTPVPPGLAPLNLPRRRGWGHLAHVASPAARPKKGRRWVGSERRKARVTGPSEPILHTQTLFIRISCSVGRRELRKVPAICILIGRGETIRKWNCADSSSDFSVFTRLHVAKKMRSKLRQSSGFWFMCSPYILYMIMGRVRLYSCVIFIFKGSNHPKIQILSLWFVNCLLKPYADLLFSKHIDIASLSSLRYAQSRIFY